MTRRSPSGHDDRPPSPPHPPRLHRALLRKVVPRRDRESAESELEELWRLRRGRDGAKAANRWYRRQVRAWVLRSLGPGGRSARSAGGRGEWRPLDRLAQDLRFAWRQLLRRPGSTVAGVAALALGIGAGTTVFSVVDGVLLRGLPFADAERLVYVQEVLAESRASMGVAPPAYLLWRDTRLRSLAGLTAFTTGGADLVAAGVPEHIDATWVGPEFFDVMGVRPALGRSFTPDEDRPGGPAAVVLSHELWTTRFASDPELVGRTVRMDGEPRTVVGITPTGFDYPAGTAAWLPLGPSLAGMEDVWGALFLEVVGRLRPGSDADAAQAELTARLADVPDAARWVAGVGSLEDRLVGDVRRPLLLLLGAVGLVVVVACANVGGLLLTRAVDRRRELAVRSALGAGRVRLASGLLVESLLLAGVAGLLGMGGAAAALDGVMALAPGDLPLSGEVAVDGRVLAFALATTLLTGLVVGVLPALRTRVDLAADIREGAGHSGSVASGRTRAVLVVGQVAVTVVLLSGAAVLGRSFVGLMSQDMGFRPRGLVTARLHLPEHLYPDEEALLAAYADLRSAAETLPGVESAAVTRNLPLAGRRLEAPVRPVDRDQQASSVHVSATPGYLELLDVRLVGGRTYTEQDVRDGRPVAVVSESFADALFAGEDPAGRRVRTMFGGEELEIVGVVGDVRHEAPGIPPTPVLYRPLAHWTSRGVDLVVRSSRPPRELIPGLRQAIRGVRPQQAIVELAAVETLRARTVARPRFLAQLVGTFAVMALLLSMLGFHGLLVSAVSQRQREIGIRMALGARRGRVLGMVVGRGVGLTALGLALGLAGALFLGRLVEGLLYEVSPADVPALAVVAVVTLLTAVAAAWPIARRATRVDPVRVMRV